jgi:uncharacterized integral membrane protein (TIGR00697 family)
MFLQNELLLVLSLVICFGGLVLLFRLFGKAGVYAWTVLETIAANIEVLILVRAFGMEMTLGNTLFASSFLATDILSEVYGKKAANKGVWLGIAATLVFLLISLTWQLYIPSENDFASASIREVFAITPRIMIASLIGYFVSEFLDVWLYHKIWSVTSEKSRDSKKFLWLRNNGATLVSQLVNTVVFNVLAFWGIYEMGTMVSIVVSTYVIYIFTSLLDTPFVYFARWMGKRCHLEEK